VKAIEIRGRRVGSEAPVYVVAEISANHGQDFARAAKLVETAKVVGADAVKLQTYTPDTMTIDSTQRWFRIEGTIWHGRSLYELYKEAYTPWEWHPRLKVIANDLGLDLFSTPFDEAAVDFLETVGVPAFKIASFEVVDIPLLRKVAKTGKPVIVSTGMATLGEIDEAVRTLRESGAEQVALLKCTSGYPAEPAEMHLKTIPSLGAAFDLPVGLSDHTLGISIPVAAVALGATIIEKHFTLSRADGGPDAAFSLEPDEFKAMVDAVRTTELALGTVRFGPDREEAASTAYRRSLFVVEDVKAGETFTATNVRAIRPAHGLHTRYLDQVIGRQAAVDIERGTPLSWDLVSGRKGL